MASMEVNSAEYVHLFAETFKLAFADRASTWPTPTLSPCLWAV